MDSPIGVPVSTAIPWSERELLSIAAHMGALAYVPWMPVLESGSVEAQRHAAVPSAELRGRNMPGARTAQAPSPA